MRDLATLSRILGEALGRHFAAQRAVEVGGGCIHRALLVEGVEGIEATAGRYFVKLGGAAQRDAFEAEADGLHALAAAAAIRVPAVVAAGSLDAQSFLVLEALELGARGDQARLGRAIARMHASTGARYGWPRDNYIGATPQHNGMDDDWPRFFRERRLRPQLERAAERGHGTRLYERGLLLVERVDVLLAGHRPEASLLHGDLWGGNAGFLRDGTPVVFDPAVSRGDAEADLAMTELFGGFGGEFYAGYREIRPIDAGYAVRKHLYNLYHVLNHANLFGGGYPGQAAAMIERLLAHTGG